MSVTRMLRSPVVVFLTIVSCVAGAPVQTGGENVGLGQAVYSQPELAEALARTYQALEWQHQDQENQAATRNLDHIGGSNLLRTLDHIGGSNLLRNLDHIGGSNLLRNLDHIGGGNLLRNIEVDKQSESDENGQSVDDNFSHGQTRGIIGTSGTDNLPSGQSTNQENSDSLDVSSLVRRDIAENEHLLKKADFQTLVSLTGKKALSEYEKNKPRKITIPTLAPGFEDDPSRWPEYRGTLDSIGGGNLLGLHANLAMKELKRTLDHIGGSNLLRDLEKSTTAENDQSMEEHNQNSRQNLRFQDRSSEWFPLSRNLDHIGGANLLRKVNDEEYRFERNLDHIGGANLLRNAVDEKSDRQRNLDHIGGANLLRNVVDDEHALQRNLDHIGGGNLLRDLNNESFDRSIPPRRQLFNGLNKKDAYRTLDSTGEPEARSLNAVNGGHLMRQTRRGLDSLSGATFGESKRWEPSRKLNERDLQTPSNWPNNLVNRVGYNQVKRNFDEIDRTDFDSFVKRNLDEIDRTGWDSFVKRRSINAYLASRQR